MLPRARTWRVERERAEMCLCEERVRDSDRINRHEQYKMSVHERERERANSLSTIAMLKATSKIALKGSTMQEHLLDNHFLKIFSFRMLMSLLGSLFSSSSSFSLPQSKNSTGILISPQDYAFGK